MCSVWLLFSNLFGDWFFETPSKLFKFSLKKTCKKCANGVLDDPGKMHFGCTVSLPLSLSHKSTLERYVNPDEDLTMAGKAKCKTNQNQNQYLFHYTDSREYVCDCVWMSGRNSNYFASIFRTSLTVFMVFSAFSFSFSWFRSFYFHFCDPTNGIHNIACTVLGVSVYIIQMDMETSIKCLLDNERIEKHYEQKRVGCRRRKAVPSSSSSSSSSRLHGSIRTDSAIHRQYLYTLHTFRIFFFFFCCCWQNMSEITMLQFDCIFSPDTQTHIRSNRLNFICNFPFSNSWAAWKGDRASLSHTHTHTYTIFRIHPI